MDWISIKYTNQWYDYFGEINNIVYEHNIIAIENPGGDFRLISNGSYTTPREFNFQIYDIYDTFHNFINKGNDLSFLSYIYLDKYKYDFMCIIYNLQITQKQKVYIAINNIGNIGGKIFNYTGYAYHIEGKGIYCIRSYAEG